MIDHSNPATWPAWMKNDLRLGGKLSDLDEDEELLASLVTAAAAPVPVGGDAREKNALDAPSWFTAAEANAWAIGWNAALEGEQTA